ncbi:AraC family transcriptional regulator N-terminal domain-containing protein [Paenibacillus sp. MAH-36]|uniref:AraC family transcriptional regulator N-terminal domain-containing protein n=1 Tax=Paenibacillus violae TaxID=3077234 RepID=A0ABU3RQ33_9BACL|nr:AraC family transcriptional regulator N-terminal domain-containing protein [Paenibacillus sp. PFR10]MDU0206405.1 AraC family transcriptional regulator N-terminal domain-containing protein [Paenibacillus sp. PFR10]
MELPIIGKIVEASPDVPYLSLKLSFDTDVILDITKDTMRTPLPMKTVGV